MKFKKGDRVRVRRWVSMANDYRTVLNEDKTISDFTDENISFTLYMEKFCNLKATIQSVVSPKEIYLHFDGDVSPEQFKFTEWMLCELQELDNL